MLDTHAAVKELTKAGLSEAAAEAIVQVQLRTLQQGLATKEDLHRATSAIKEDLYSTTSAIKEELYRTTSAIKEELSDYRIEVERRFGGVEKRFSALEGSLGEFKVEVEKRFGRLTMLTWVVLAIVLLSNPIAARLLEGLLGVSL